MMSNIFGLFRIKRARKNNQSATMAITSGNIYGKMFLTQELQGILDDYKDKLNAEYGNYPLWEKFDTVFVPWKKIGNRRAIIDCLQTAIRKFPNSVNLVIAIQVAIRNITVNPGRSSTLRDQLEQLIRRVKNREFVIAGTNTEKFPKEINRLKRKLYDNKECFEFNIKRIKERYTSELFKLQEQNERDTEMKIKEAERNFSVTVREINRNLKMDFNEKIDKFMQGFEFMHEAFKISADYFSIENPSGFCCSLSGEIMKDPVTLSSGATYEREKIFEYYNEAKKKNSNNEYKCPVTRKKVTGNPMDIGTNISLLDAIEEYNCTRKKFFAPFENNTKHIMSNSKSSSFFSRLKDDNNFQDVYEVTLYPKGCGNIDKINQNISVLYVLIKNNDIHSFFILEYVDESGFRKFKKIHLVLDNEYPNHEKISNVIGDAKIITSDVAIEDLRGEAIGGYRGICISINKRTQNKFFEVVDKWRNKLIKYNRNGEQSIYKIHHGNYKFHNCFSWCKTILKKIKKLPEEWDKKRLSLDFHADDPRKYLIQSLQLTAVDNEFQNKF